VSDDMPTIASLGLARYGFAGQYSRELSDARKVALSLAGYRWSGSGLFDKNTFLVGWVIERETHWIGYYSPTRIDFWAPDKEAVMSVLEDLVIEP
jgi:hypothetical protein